jgi:hypothetical protein
MSKVIQFSHTKPKATVIIRTGDRTLEGQFNRIKNLFSEFRNGFQRLDYFVFATGLDIQRRIICVPQSYLQGCLDFVHEKGYDLLGFEFMGRPEGKSFGEDYNYMEHHLIKNPEYLIITDDDMIAPTRSNHLPGMTKQSPNDFSAAVAYQLRGMRHFGITLSSIQHQNNLGAEVEGLGMEARNRETGHHDIDKNLYLRNFWVISKDAKGTWRPVNYLEDRGRCLSEIKNGGIISEFSGTAVRYPEKEKMSKRYGYSDKDGDWKKEYEILAKLYPECSLPQGRTWTFHGVHKVPTSKDNK